MNGERELPEAEWAVIGAVGEPGHRTFYLQAGLGDEGITLKLEKQHVQALTEYLGEILADLPAPEPHLADHEPGGLREPVQANWDAGSLRLSYDSALDRIVVAAEEIRPVETGPGETGPGEHPEDVRTAVIGLSRRQAAAMVAAGKELLGSGRPLCHLCGRPVDPEGHSCPRANGHRPH